METNRFIREYINARGGVVELEQVEKKTLAVLAEGVDWKKTNPVLQAQLDAWKDLKTDLDYSRRFENGAPVTYKDFIQKHGNVNIIYLQGLVDNGFVSINGKTGEGNIFNKKGMLGIVKKPTHLIKYTRKSYKIQPIIG